MRLSPLCVPRHLAVWEVALSSVNMGWRAIPNQMSSAIRQDENMTQSSRWTGIFASRHLFITRNANKIWWLTNVIWLAQQDALRSVNGRLPIVLVATTSDQQKASHTPVVSFQSLNRQIGTRHDDLICVRIFIASYVNLKNHF